MPSTCPLPGTDPAALLAAWDEQTRVIEPRLPAVPEQRYGETVTSPWSEMLVLAAVTGAIDDELHHRGYGMVYLRELGLEPPAFWERA